MSYPRHTQTPALQRIQDVLSRSAPLSATKIARHAFVSESTLRNGGYLNALRKAGHIHISGWERNATGRNEPLYAAGPCDESTPAQRAARNTARLEAILDLLQRHGPLTYREVALLLGLSATIVKNARYLTLLLDAGKVHIKSWRRSRPGPMQAVYAAGAGCSAPRPSPLSTAERSRRSRQIRRILVTPQPSLGLQLQSFLRTALSSRTASAA